MKLDKFQNKASYSEEKIILQTYIISSPGGHVNSK